VLCCFCVALFDNKSLTAVPSCPFTYVSLGLDDVLIRFDRIWFRWTQWLSRLSPNVSRCSALTTAVNVLMSSLAYHNLMEVPA